MTEIERQENWKETLWNELSQLPLEDRFVTSGEWITWITYNLLPALAAHRRDCVVDMIDLEGWDINKISGHFGMRRSAVTRLLDEGRATRKQIRMARDAMEVLEPVPGLDEAA